ncbi:MAG: UDP-galactopyranose mutase [Bacteroidota bacterium]|nr:UDP-galactopyranose mutase [Bacteroidota bacterium]
MRKTISHKNYDLLVVGAGLTGAVLAERYASQRNKKVLVIDKREHIGGNCYDYIDENGILVSKYGAHLFHTNYEDVWAYISEFCEWQRWDHQVLSYIEGKLVNVPVNINTVNALCGTHIKDENEMNQWLENVQVKKGKINNSKEMAESRVGEELYKKMIRNYTFKQWNKYPEELDPSVLARIPIRNNFDVRYFNDRYQALPKNGYTHFIRTLLAHNNITISTKSDYFEIKDKVNYGKVIYTGPIDRYFDKSGLEKLEYRSIQFNIEHYKSMNFYQTNSVVNYPEEDVPYTRIVEYKHFLNQQSKHTTIVKEITNDSGEPYYPVPNSRNIAIYEQYKKLAEIEKDVYFIGRLANYNYVNMDQAIKNSLDFYYDHCESDF